MNPSALTHLPDSAQIWFYAYAEPLSDEDKRLIAAQLDAFVPQWNTHEVPVAGAYQIVHDHFVILAGWADAVRLGGCAIDASVQTLKHLRDTHGLDGFTQALVYFRDSDGNVRSLDRTAFQIEVDAGRAGPDTVVFDMTLQTLGDYRAGAFETTFGKCWHALAFSRQTSPK